MISTKQKEVVKSYGLKDVPNLNDRLHLQEMDSSSTQRLFLVEVGEEKSFQINENLYDIVSQIDGKKTIEDIADDYSKLKNKEVDLTEFLEVINKVLAPRKIILPNGKKREQTDSTDNGENLKKYNKRVSFLLVQLPLLTGKYINRLTDRLRLLFSPLIAWPVLTISVSLQVLLFSLYLKPTMINPEFLLVPSNLVILYLIGNFTNVFHELGHASSMKYYHLPHGPIGVGLYFIFPVLYTDVRKIWRLNRTQRIVVNLGGYYFEQFTLILVSLLFLITRNPLYLFILFFMDIKICFGLNPAFKFDGYYVLSDLIGVTNLKDKAKKILVNLLRFNKNNLLGIYQQYSPKVFGIVITYMILSYLFFGFFYYHLIMISIHFIPNVPKIIVDLYNGIGQHTFNFWLRNLKKLVINLAFSMIVVRICYVTARRVFNLLKKPV